MDERLLVNGSFLTTECLCAHHVSLEAVCHCDFFIVTGPGRQEQTLNWRPLNSKRNLIVARPSPAPARARGAAAAARGNANRGRARPQSGRRAERQHVLKDGVVRQPLLLLLLVACGGRQGGRPQGLKVLGEGFQG